MKLRLVPTPDSYRQGNGYWLVTWRRSNGLVTEWPSEATDYDGFHDTVRSLLLRGADVWTPADVEMSDDGGMTWRTWKRSMDAAMAMEEVTAHELVYGEAREGDGK